MNTILQCSREDLKKELESIYNEMYIDAETRAELRANDQLLKTEEVCETLKISPVTLWRWAKKGYLSPIQVGSKKRFKRSDITLIIERGGSYEDK